MPELPEVEVLVRHLAPLVRNRTIRRAVVRRPRIVGPSTAEQITRKLRGATFLALTRRGKYLLFEMCAANGKRFPLVGHLGMTGRMYLLPERSALPKHAAVVFELGGENFVFEDTRYFGRMTLDDAAIAALGPEPLGDGFTAEYFALALR